MEIIKLLPVNIFMAVTKFPRLTFCCFLKGGNFGSLVSSGFFSKKPTAEIGYFAFSKKGREKIRMVKAAKSCNMSTKNGDQQERELE